MDILNKPRRSLLAMLILLTLVVAAGSGLSYAINVSTQKQKVIAGAIYKFIKFIDWEDGLVQTKSSFNVCLQRYDPAFEPFKSRQIQGKAIQIHLLNKQVPPTDCHVVYLNQDSTDNSELFASLKNKPILTISGQKQFAAQGGIIELGDRNNRLSFAINQAVAKANRLNIGFQLLSLANEVIEN